MNAQARLKMLERLAVLMDSQFRVPGTNIRFGLDPLIGLIPGIGDFSTFLVSGFMVLILAENGASGFLVARMTFNIVLDAVLGSIPIIGDTFDFAFKANRINMRLMREHYVEGRHGGGAWKVVVPLLLVALLVIAAIAWGSYRFFRWLFSGW